MKKRDVIFALLLILVFVSVFLFIRGGDKGTYITVSVDGVIEGSYILTENEQVINIGDGNVLTIINNEAYMSYANCPDGICIKKGKVSESGEDIICMPNRVIVRVEGGVTVE